MQQTSIGAELRFLELEELQLAGGCDMAKGPGAAGGIASETEPHAIHGTVGCGHSDGRATDVWRNRQLRRLAAGDVDAHDRRVSVLRDIDQLRGGLLLDEHGAVEALVQNLVGGVRDICREHIVLASFLGCDLEAGPDAVTDLKHTMRAVPRLRDINGLNYGRDGGEILAWIHEQELIVALQRQPHLARVHR